MTWGDRDTWVRREEPGRRGVPTVLYSESLNSDNHLLPEGHLLGYTQLPRSTT